jgi:catechol 2,3-dioxygenase-like lactoylglutathione lyase family enzyme
VIELAKDAIDVGFFTESIDESMAFWRDDVGVPYAELLPTGGGIRQHRFAAGDSVVKVNHSRHPLPTGGTTTLSAVVIAIPTATTSKTLATPDGVVVIVEPSSDKGISLRIVVHSPRPDDVGSFWSRLGLAKHVSVEADSDARYAGDMRSVGWRYLTAQVRDIGAAHAELIAAGVREVAPPRRLGDVAAISFVADPDGVPIEISQRASLVGELPD